MTTFDDRFDELWNLSYRVAFRILGNREEAADVAQETLARVAERWRRVEGYAPAFAAKVAGDRAIDLWRRNHHARSIPNTAPATIVAVDERADLVEALRRLPTRQRQTVVLRYLADLSEHQTAAALGCSEGTVKQHASRGLASLRVILAPT